MPETSRARTVINILLVPLLLGGLAGWGCFFLLRPGVQRTNAIIEKMMKDSEGQIQTLESMLKEGKEAAAQRETEFAARSEELRQREAAIDGREDAATERTQSSFQGLLIQQQLTRNLEALKASLPDMTPEVEKLAREHAQLGAERQRLEKENADLRRRLREPARP